MHSENKLVYLAVVMIGLSLFCGCTNVEQRISRQLDVVIERELNESGKRQRDDSVLVALYLDTKGSKDETTIAEYRCYNYPHGGYSGIKRIPLGTPWTRWERIRSNRYKKEIVIDPGPPYKKAKKIVTLIPGEITNLGRIVLEEVKARGTASIVGTIRDEAGKELGGATVSLNSKVATTDAEGSYRIDGLGLDVYDISVEEEGYISVSEEVSIRNMDKRIIEENFVLIRPKKIRLRYIISPLEKDDFSSSEAVKGTVDFVVDKASVPLFAEHIENEEFNRFIDDVRLKFRVEDGKITLTNSYAPIFYKRYSSSFEAFEKIRSAGDMDYNSQHCPPIKEGDVILINGGNVSDYTIKILFEEVRDILP